MTAGVAERRFADVYGEYMKSARLRSQLSVADLAGRAGISADAIYKFERNVNQPELRTLDRIAGAMGILIGDLLPNSGGSTNGSLFEPLEAALSGLDVSEQSEQVLLLANQARLVRNAILRRRPALPEVLQFPVSEKTEPRSTPEFPIDPAEFNSRGDADYPLELHGWEMDDLQAAAGVVGAQNPENLMGTLLNAKEVRDGRRRTIKVQGNSMSPTFEDGDLLAIDVTKRSPANDTTVLVYRHEDDGMMIGRWEKKASRVRLLKDNDAFAPVDLREGDLLVGEIIDIIKKPVPPPPPRKRK